MNQARRARSERRSVPLLLLQILYNHHIAVEESGAEVAATPSSQMLVLEALVQNGTTPDTFAASDPETVTGAGETSAGDVREGLRLLKRTGSVLGERKLIRFVRSPERQRLMEFDHVCRSDHICSPPRTAVGSMGCSDHE